MKKILFLIMAALVIVGCSKGDGTETPVVNIQLSKTEVNLSVKEETNITVSGVDISDCKITTEDEFVAYALSYNGKLNITADHVGKTKIIIDYEGKTAECTVEVTPVNDFVASTVTEFGISKNELKSKVEKPYDSYMSNGQTGTVDVTYTCSGYKITNSYYWENSMLCGVRKKIISNDSDTQALINISKSMMERMELINTSSSTVNSYPKGHRNTYTFSLPDKCYAVYEQTKYDILYETGKSPATTNYIYFAKDLESAQKHSFTN